MAFLCQIEARLFQAHRAGQASAVLNMRGKSYVVDFQLMDQTNTRTRFKRHVRRGQSHTLKAYNTSW